MKQWMSLTAIALAAVVFSTPGLQAADRTDRLAGYFQRIDSAIKRKDADRAEKELAEATRAAGKDPAYEVQAAFAEATAMIRFLRNDPAGGRNHILDFLHATWKQYGERSREATVAVQRYADFLERSGDIKSAESMLLLATSLTTDCLAASHLDEFSNCLERLEDFYQSNHEPQLLAGVSALRPLTYPTLGGFGEALEKVRGELLSFDRSGRVLDEVGRLFDDAHLQTDEGRRVLASQTLSFLLFQRGLFQEARLHFERVMNYAEANGAPRYSIFTRNNLLATYIPEGKLDEAEKVALDAVAQIERLDGPLSPLLESFLHNLLGIDQRRENTKGALRWADQLVQVAEAAHGKDAPETWNAKFHRVDMRAAANLPGAIEEFQKLGIEMIGVVRRSESAQALATMKDAVAVASVGLQVMGEPIAGIQLMDTFAERLEQLAPPDKNPGMAEYLLTIRSASAVQLQQLGALDRAAELVRAAYRAQADRPLSGTEAMGTFESIAVDIGIEQLIEAGLDGADRQELLKQATSWHEQRLGRFQQRRIPPGETLYYKRLREIEGSELALAGARLAFERGEISTAERELARVEVGEKDRIENALLSGQLAMAAGHQKAAIAALLGGKLDRPWQELHREFLGNVSPRTYFRAVLLLCGALQRKGDSTEAREWVDRSERIYSDYFAQLRAQWPPELILSGNLFREIAGVAATSADPLRIADVLARHKGEAGAGAKMNQSARVKELRNAMGKLLRDLPSDPAEWKAEHRSAELEIAKLQRSIESELVREQVDVAPVNFTQVQAALDPGKLLADFVEFRAATSEGQIESHYGVLLARRDEVPRWRVLREGDRPIPARELDALVASVRDMIEKPLSGTSEDRVLETLARLYSIIWTPVREAMGVTGVTEVIVAPDGALSEVPFAALCMSVEKFRFLCEEPFDVRFIGSMRDLLKPFERPKGGRILVIAAPNLPPSASVRERRSYQKDEAQMIETHAPELGFSVPKPLVGDDATEESAQARLGMNDSDILHFSVHGYGRDAERNAFQDFAGFGGIKLRPSPDVPGDFFRDGDSLTPADGWLSWREIACLKLDHAWLAVLSSCSTGLGARRAGEGVLGMRWGFREAGVPAQLLTLWDIDDAPDTVAFMQAFYEEVSLKDADPRTAAWRLQRCFLPTAARRVAQDAIRVYGGFVLYSSGR